MKRERERDVCFIGALTKVRVAAYMKSGKRGSAFWGTYTCIVNLG